MARRPSSSKLAADMTSPTAATVPRSCTRSGLALCVLIGLAGGCRIAPTTLAPDDAAALDRAAHARDRIGALVYVGEVFALGGTERRRPLFTYERRVREAGPLRVSTHLTHAADDLLISLAATHTPRYELVDFSQIDRQSGVSGSVRMLDAHHVAFERTRDGRVRSRVETVDAPVVVGPTLFGWALVHWDVLLRGEPQRLRFAMVDAARTYGFRLALEHSTPSVTVLSLTATSALVRASVPPMRLVFDTATRKILRYEGRVPPMLPDPRGLRPLDAHVEYGFAAAEYR